MYMYMHMYMCTCDMCGMCGRLAGPHPWVAACAPPGGGGIANIRVAYKSAAILNRGNREVGTRNKTQDMSCVMLMEMDTATYRAGRVPCP